MANHHEILVRDFYVQQWVLEGSRRDLFTFALCSRGGPLLGAIVVTIRIVFQERCLLSLRAFQTLHHWVISKAFLRSLINLSNIHMIFIIFIEADKLFTIIVVKHLNWFDILLDWLHRVHSWFLLTILGFLILKKLGHIDFHLGILCWATNLVCLLSCLNFKSSNFFFSWCTEIWILIINLNHVVYRMIVNNNVIIGTPIDCAASLGVFLTVFNGRSLTFSLL